MKFIFALFSLISVVRGATLLNITGITIEAGKHVPGPYCEKIPTTNCNNGVPQPTLVSMDGSTPGSIPCEVYAGASLTVMNQFMAVSNSSTLTYTGSLAAMGIKIVSWDQQLSNGFVAGQEYTATADINLPSAIPGGLTLQARTEISDKLTGIGQSCSDFIVRLANNVK